MPALMWIVPLHSALKHHRKRQLEPRLTPIDPHRAPLISRCAVLEPASGALNSAIAPLFSGSGARKCQFRNARASPRAAQARPRGKKDPSPRARDSVGGARDAIRSGRGRPRVCKSSRFAAKNPRPACGDPPLRGETRPAASSARPCDTPNTRRKYRRRGKTAVQLSTLRSRGTRKTVTRS